MADVQSPEDVDDAACPAGSTEVGWLEVYSSGATAWKWSTQTGDHDARRIYVEFAETGAHTLELSARADSMLRDRVLLCRETVESSAAQAEGVELAPCVQSAEAMSQLTMTRTEPEPVATTRTSEYFVDPNGIIVQKITSRDQQSLEDARANTRAFDSLTQGRKRLLLVDMQVAYSTGPGVREYYASAEAAEFVAALAMITPSATSRIIGNFFLSMNRPPYPCRMFKTSEEATRWLLGFGR